MQFETWESQEARWPQKGRHILASFDDETVVVYQAYRPSIGRYAIEHQRFGGEFGFGRMSWIKPNFLWMMYRSGWGTKSDQEITLGIRMRRTAFDAILRAAVPSSFVPALYDTREAWAADVESSDVRLQWDPDHDPAGKPRERRAIQLGLRRDVLARYANDDVVEVLDLSPFVAEQRGRPDLVTPLERVYPVTDPETIRRLGLDT